MTNRKIVYVSLEYALEENLPIYAGGLGVLAGDLTLEAGSPFFSGKEGSDGVDFTAIGLFYSQGFHTHTTEDTVPLDPKSANFQKLTADSGQPLTFSVPVDSREVWVQVWFKTYGQAKLYLFDSNLSINSETDRNITKFLYGPDHDTMLLQQTVLAYAAVSLFSHMNLTPDIVHLNEGHTSLLILTLALSLMKKSPPVTLAEALEKVKEKVVATKHTILTGGGMHITKIQIEKALGAILNIQKLTVDEIFALGTHPTHPETFSTTNFLLRYSKRGSAVSMAHALAEKKLHPHSNLIAITNGINKARWQSDCQCGKNLLNLSEDELWQIHGENKAELLKYIDNSFGKKLDPTVLTVTWARRFTSYKRPELLFSNMQELSKLTKLLPSAQFIIAGQTNPSDSDAADLADQIKRNLEEQKLDARVAFITKYDLALAQKLVAGSDVWLNTPIPGMEASGTSGMKAGINGVLEFSTNDGWISEVDWTEVGWILPEENISEKLYQILEKEIIPLYYQMNGTHLPHAWIARMRQTIKIIEEKYTTTRLLKDYLDKLYFPKE